MWFPLKSYIKFLLSSRNQHGVHSPFVYELVTKCFYDKERKKTYHKIATYRKDLFRDQNEIKVEDLGSGSKVFKSNQRKISAIANNAGISWKRSKLLYRLTAYLNIKNSIELGTSVGLATASLATSPNNKVLSIEACATTSSIAKKYLQKHQFTNVQLEISTFEKMIPQLQQKYDLAYIDGNHSYEATLKNFELLLPHKHNHSIFIFDDIYWSPEMQKAWQEIQQHPEVSVTIDTFHWGLVFFRKEQAKEHFKIRV